MARIKYYYDTESCRYERIRTSKRDIFMNSLAFLTVATIIATGLVFGYMVYFESPEELQLRKENQELMAFLKHYHQSFKRNDYSKKQVILVLIGKIQRMYGKK